MKMHKFEIHVLDFEDRGPEQYSEMLKYVRHIVGQNFHVGTTDIGKWSDDHEWINPKPITIAQHLTRHCNKCKIQQTFNYGLGRWETYDAT